MADAMIANQVDLVVIEGMGRVIHTNLHAKFKCDVLKVWISYLSCLFFNIFVVMIVLFLFLNFQVAVIKNRWLAKRFGEQEDTFPVVFQFERKTVS